MLKGAVPFQQGRGRGPLVDARGEQIIKLSAHFYSFKISSIIGSIAASQPSQPTYACTPNIGPLLAPDDDDDGSSRSLQQESNIIDR